MVIQPWFPKFASFFLILLARESCAGCPPKDAIPKCTCSDLSSDSLEKLAVICDGISVANVASKFANLGPLDLTIKNGALKTVSNKDLRGLNLGKLALISNDISRISAGDLKGLSTSLRELLIKDLALQVIEEAAFTDLTSLQNLTIMNAHSLERIPKISNLPVLTTVAFADNSVKFLESGTFSNLPNLREINLQNNKIEVFDMRTFGDLPAVTKLDLSGNSIFDVSYLSLVLRPLPLLNYLFLQRNKITALPNGFLDGFESILLIDLRWNQINKLPDRLLTSDSSTLRELYLGQNHIIEVPPHTFENVTGLKTLSIANNSINVLNKQLAPLKDLLYLRLEGNRLQRIDTEAFKNLTRLQILSLSNNLLAALERGLFDLPSLLTLDLSKNYINEFRGTEFKHLPKLEVLLFSNNKLRNLFAGFETLVSLKRLDLSNNQISNIEDSTFASMKNLETLQLDGNLFMKVPLGALKHLQNLERLTMGSNRIHFLAQFIPIGHLKYLSLDKNSMQSLSPDMFAALPELRQLLLNDNMLSVLEPGCFNNLLTLYIMNLSGNRLPSIAPKVLDNLVSLESLDLSLNELQHVTDGMLGNLPSLRSVDLSQNKILSVTDKALLTLPHLAQVNMSRNMLNMVPPTITKLTKLRKVDLSTNSITRVEDSSFAGLVNLESLYLGTNPICYVGSKAFTGVTKLGALDLSNIPLRRLPETAFRPGQDFSTVNLDGSTIECDCNVKWLRMLKPDLRCAYGGTLMQAKISQVNPELFVCLRDRDTHGFDDCAVVAIPTRPPRVGVAPAVEPVVATTEGPEEQILAKGSVTQAWLTQGEQEQKAEEWAAIQSAKLTRQASSGVDSLTKTSLTTFVLIWFFRLLVV